LNTVAPLLALVRLGEPTLDPTTVCEAAGVDRDVGDRLWRALGFPDVPEGVLAYTADDARALRLATQGLEDVEGSERDRAEQLILDEARMVSAYLTALADAELDSLAAEASLGLRRGVLADAVERGLDRSELGWLILYVLRRRLDAVIKRRSTSGEDADIQGEQLAVAFIDLTGFTRWSDQVGLGEISEMLRRFEAHVFDSVAEANGRVVKLIGDEVMFVCPAAADAARACLEIVEARDPALLPARAGLSYGRALRRSGDYFGPTVNLASRINAIAEPRSLVVDDAAHAALGGEGGFEAVPVGRQELKGLGAVGLWQLWRATGVTAREDSSAAGDSPPGA
jgi:adenylate cyclase